MLLKVAGIFPIYTKAKSKLPRWGRRKSMTDKIEYKSGTNWKNTRKKENFNPKNSKLCFEPPDSISFAFAEKNMLKLKTIIITYANSAIPVSTVFCARVYFA